MSYSSSPPPSGGVNPYGNEPEQPDPARPAGAPSWQTSSGASSPSYGTPPPSGYQAPPPPAAPNPPPQYGSATGYGPPTGYGGPAAQYSPYTSAADAPGAPGYGGWYTSNRDNGKGTGALIMGIVGVVLCAVPLVGLGLGIGAIVMGSQGRRAAAGGTADNNGAAMAGFVLGIVAVVLGVVATISALASFTQS